MTSMAIRAGMSLFVALALASPAPAGETRTYSYDARGRLVRTQAIQGPQGTITEYFLDRAGNRALVEANRSTVGGLAPRTQIQTGQTIASPDGRLFLRLQGDGNLVLYDAQRRPVWATNSFGSGTFTFVMQNDGNLVLYNHTMTPVWWSNTFGYNNYFSVQSDGNLVVYSAGGTPLWTSNTFSP